MGLHTGLDMDGQEPGQRLLAAHYQAPAFSPAGPQLEEATVIKNDITRYFKFLCKKSTGNEVISCVQADLYHTVYEREGWITLDKNVDVKIMYQKKKKKSRIQKLRKSM